MAWTFILLGLILVAVGLLWPWIGWLRLGRLPGDALLASIGAAEAGRSGTLFAGF